MLLLPCIKYPDKGNLSGGGREHLFQIIVQNNSPSLWGCGVQLWDLGSAAVERWRGEGGSPTVRYWGPLVILCLQSEEQQELYTC